MNIRNRIKAFRTVTPDEVAPNPRNWRTHPQAQRDALRGLLAQVGIVAPVIAYETPNGLMLIDGHERMTVGVPFPCAILDVNEDEANTLLATFDPLTALAGTDAEALDALLRDVSTDSPALTQMLADLANEAGLYADKSGTPDDELPDVASAITQPGDIWLLDDHRLLCGDAMNPDHVRLLLNGVEPALYICDPPYDLDAVQQAQLLNSLKSRQILWMSGTPAAYEIWRHCTRKDYRWTIFWEGGTAMAFPNQNRPNINTDLFLAFGRDGLFRKEEAIPIFGTEGMAVPQCLRIGRDFATTRHTPFQKPIKLFSGLVALLSEPGDVVADLFLSSGTTLVSAQSLDRVCYGMEINPLFCDIAVNRWEQLTGNQAVRVPAEG
jgi:hypothetical protein